MVTINVISDSKEKKRPDFSNYGLIAKKKIMKKWADIGKALTKAKKQAPRKYPLKKTSSSSCKAKVPMKEKIRFLEKTLTFFTSNFFSSTHFFLSNDA